MYFTARAALVRNLGVAAVNGLVTYIILIIAPLGLMAVVINTVLVMVASYGTATLGDRIITYLFKDSPSVRELGQSDDLQRRPSDDLDRR